jgi:hypothetical protein
MVDIRGRHRRQAVCLWILWTGLVPAAGAGPVVSWDFAQGLSGWKANAFVERLSSGSEGLVFQSTGVDPWIEGPGIDLPGDGMTRVTVRMRSRANAAGELFHGAVFRAGHSVPFVVQNDGQWHDYELIIAEPLGRGTRFRLDPASSPGEVGVASIRVESLARPPEVPLERPVRRTVQPRPGCTVRSGDLTVSHGGGALGDLLISVAGREMALGYRAEVIGVILGDKVEWLRLGDGAAKMEVGEAAFSAEVALTDHQGGHWTIRRRISSRRAVGAVFVETCFEVDEDREVIYLPWLMLHCGLGTFGGHKAQAVLPGLEYLEDEPSSSQADITTPDHVRRMPDPVKVTFPLMALASNGAYLGLVWEPSPLASPLFDSPDRLIGSDSHLMAVTGPAVGRLRFENTLAAHSPVHLAKGQALTGTVTIIGGEGQTIVPAVQHCALGLRGLPELPSWKGGLQSAAELLGHGWKDSQIRQSGRVRHAVWSDSFGSGPAADAAVHMDWLSASLDPQGMPLADGLRAARDLALAALPADDPYASGVSHVRLPAAPLVFGRAQAYVRGRAEQARSLLKGFDDNGLKIYRPAKTDYGATHFAKHANGYGAADLAAILEAAALSGEASLTREALELLDKQTKQYQGTVPRGAQTWEVPLHTPDILASAYMTRAYCLGYVLSARQEHLDQARYWAWTGVPFIYLADPTPGEVGRYATIPVFGATDWQGSWFGRPVQWCGLVYASALRLLSSYDPGGPWPVMAKGITLTGLQMCWPVTDTARQGLLPDFYHLKGQVSDGPAINPGTLEAHLAEAFDSGTMYDLCRLKGEGWLIHAPCAIRVTESSSCVTLSLAGWGARGGSRPYHVWVSGVKARPDGIYRIAPGGQPSEPAAFEFDASMGLLVIEAAGPTELRLGPAVPAVVNP